MEPLSRRRALVGAGLALPVLAGCGGESESGDTGASDPDTSASSSPSTSASASASPTETSEAAEPTSQAAAGLVATKDVPVGGGVILEDEKLVVTQPQEGTFKAFGSTCTHAGCQVTTVSDGTINCPCHGSTYSIEDGSVQGGPAPSPLPETAVAADGGQVRRA